MDRGCIVAAEHAQEIFEDVRLDAACGVRFERLKVGRHTLLRRLASSIVYSRQTA